MTKFSNIRVAILSAFLNNACRIVCRNCQRNNTFQSWFQTFAVFWTLYAFFWVIPQRLNFICQRFGIICLFIFSTPVIFHTYPPVKMEETVCSETLAYKIQTPGNYPEESIQQHVSCCKHSQFPSIFPLCCILSYFLNFFIGVHMAKCFTNCSKRCSYEKKSKEWTHVLVLSNKNLYIVELPRNW